MDGGGFRRSQSHSCQGCPRDDGQNGERASPAACSPRREVRAYGARRSRISRGADCVSAFDIKGIEKRIDALADTPASSRLAEDARAVVDDLLDALERGVVRAAEKDSATGEWRAVPWV